MQRMPNIDLTKEQLAEIKRKRIGMGSEGIIYFSKSHNTAYKIFSFNQRMDENKEKKITKLYQMDIEHSVKPLQTISYDGLLIGYEMTYDSEFKELKPFRLPRKELIHFLQQTKEQLQYFSEHDITYGDVAPRNILINQRTGASLFCDMDNIRLEDLPIDIMSPTLKSYSTVRGIDQNTDAYMHSIMTLNAFDLDEKFCDIDEFRYNFTKEGEKILREIRQKENYSGEYMIQYVKKSRR